MPDESKIKGDGRMPYPRFVNLSVNGYKTATSMILTAWLEKFPKQKKDLGFGLYSSTSKPEDWQTMITN
jgi:hypothetical protein